MKTAGLVLDHYDDQGALLLKLAPPDQIPDFVKESSFVGGEDVTTLPNEQFALRAVDGGSVLRKYATATPGDTWASTLYFLHNKGLLTKTAQAQTVYNLVQAHRHYDIPPPDELLKLAVSLLTGEAPDSVIDVTGQTPQPELVREKVAAKYLILGKYPIVDYGQVKQASEFFAENCLRLHPKERREFAIKLAARAEELQFPVSPTLHKYASSEAAPDAEMYILQRKEFLPEDRHGDLEKFASAFRDDPVAAADVLCSFDESTGMSALWDHHVVDPYFSMLGQFKEAEYTDVRGAERVTETDLVHLARNGRPLVEQTFGEETAEEFVKDPVAVYKSLPDPSKVIMSRMASDRGYSPSQV